jgi:hypothetical protein
MGAPSRSWRRQRCWAAGRASASATDVEAQAEDAARVARVDDAVVPQPGGAEQRRGFGVELPAQAFAHCRQRGFVGRLAGAFELAAADDLHHLGGLRRTHHGGARRGPGEDEARVEAAPAHAVVAGAEGAAEHHGELGHARIGHGLDHLRAVLDGAGALAAAPTM